MGAKVTSVVAIDVIGKPDEYSEEETMKLVMVQPLVLSMHWGPNLQRDNGKGLYNEESWFYWLKDKVKFTRAPKHSVLLIGFGNNEHGDYWLIQNSYGVGSGDNGEFRIRRGGEVDLLFEKMEGGKLNGDGLVTMVSFPLRAT